MKDPGTPYHLEMGDDSLSSTEELSHLSTSTSRGVFPYEYVCERDAVFYASSKMDPEMPWLERSANYPAEASCMLIVHITRWKNVWVHCRDPTERLGLHFISKRGLTGLWQHESHVEFTASNFDDAWQFFNIVRNPNITVSNRKRDLNSHLCSRSVRIVLLRLVYIPELSLIPRQVTWLHWTNSNFECTSPP